MSNTIYIHSNLMSAGREREEPTSNPFQLDGETQVYYAICEHKGPGQITAMCLAELWGSVRHNRLIKKICTLPTLRLFNTRYHRSSQG